MSKNEQMVGISRRTLVKSTAIGSLALAAGGFSLPFTLRSAAAAVQQAREKVIETLNRKTLAQNTAQAFEDIIKYPRKKLIKKATLFTAT